MCAVYCGVSLSAIRPAGHGLHDVVQRVRYYQKGDDRECAFEIELGAMILHWLRERSEFVASVVMGVEQVHSDRWSQCCNCDPGKHAVRKRIGMGTEDKGRIFHQMRHPACPRRPPVVIYES